MADINIQEVTNHINIETANGYNLEFNGPVVNMNVVLSNYYTKTETDALLNDKADKADTYTKSETNILLNDKADKADTYTISQINDMVQNINTAVDTKQNIITGAASTITDSNLTANRAVISNGSGKVAVSNVTSTELGYLSGVTSEVQTQLNNKASTSLDNLSTAGQMIVDSQNGTISNCILEIPQNIKLEIVNGHPVIKAGSKVALTGATYTETTITQDTVIGIQNFGVSDGLVFYTSFVSSYLGYVPLSRIYSGSSQPTVSGNTNLWFNTEDKKIYYTLNAGADWNTLSVFSFPLAAVHMNSSGQITNFLKDSNGNDMIFNGAGFIGHHAFIYPNVKALLPDEFNTDGSLKSSKILTDTLQIIKLLTQLGRSLCFAGSKNIGSIAFVSVKNKNELQQQYLYQYCQETNSTWLWNNSAWQNNTKRCQFVAYTYNGTTVTDFTIRQPVRMATVEMLNNTLGDIETLLAAI